MHFNWLHLTDFHQGMGDQDWLWPNVREEFFRDLKRLYEKSGPWDLILFTGDLSNRGDPREFERFDRELEKLRSELKKIDAACAPMLLAVPGNHDLVRPSLKNPIVKHLARWGDDADVMDEFWTAPECDYRQAIDAAFAGYQHWWDSASAPVAGLQHGLLPGDFSVTIEKDGARLGIVGLNTAFLQLADGDYQGKLALHTRQFHAACGGSGPDWAHAHHACLLMTHHGPSWLNEDSRQQLDGEIAAYGRFALHLFGHAHETALLALSQDGAETRHQFQGRSLFGLEHYQEVRAGVATPKRDRSHGYAAGRIEILAHDRRGRLTLWPRLAHRQGAQLRLVPDPNVALTEEQHTVPLSFDLRAPYSGGQENGSESSDDGAHPGGRWDMQRLDRTGVLAELACIFDEQRAAHALLERAGFPRQHLPRFGDRTPALFWEGVCQQVLNGRMPGGIDALLSEAAREYPANARFRAWGQRRSAP